MDNTNFSISGSAQSAPKPIEIRINKEWVKRLLAEFHETACIDFRNESFSDFYPKPEEFDAFLDNSEVWNGR